MKLVMTSYRLSKMSGGFGETSYRLGEMSGGFRETGFLDIPPSSLHIPSIHPPP